ncbi:hypothetical protein [Kitasatospora sp. GP82]|uniref:hypothetical protein n=1 Tax=Kitasatospora sp. GP82 TaxID=3035089 RepID=UPI0024753667|nr:hypothetical protein [Kitasatospora sp. GP82]MDH6124888.1 hypothetical protein [Kitasatospora sp. GP82]
MASYRAGVGRFPGSQSSPVMVWTPNRPGRFPDGMPLFELDGLRAGLAAARLTVRDGYTPGTFVVLTAGRAA